MCEPKESSTRYVLEEMCIRDASYMVTIFANLSEFIHSNECFFFFLWHEPLQRLYVEFNDAAIAQNTFEAILLE